MIANDPAFLQVGSEDSNQNASIGRLICVFTDCRFLKVHFHILRHLFACVEILWPSQPNEVMLSASVAQLDEPSAWRPEGHRFNPRQGQ